MNEEEQCCGTCRHHVPDTTFPSDWYCVNDKSYHCSDFTEYDETCSEWEPDEEAKK